MNFPPYSSLFCFLLLLLVSSSLGQRQQWEPANYPNPTAGDFQRCNMRSRALLCDPDSVLSEAERYKLNYELQQLESSTRQEHGREFCERKGITAAVALAKRVRGGNEEAVRAMANDMLGRWNIDAQCQKAIVIVLSTEDRHFWVARRPRVPVYSTELNELFKAERETFRSGRYGAGIQNVVRAIRDAALAKQQPAPDDGRSKGTPFVPPKPSRPQPEPSGGGGGLKLNWLLLLALFFFVVLPLLCCCCCLYFCCFRKKDGGGGGGGGENPNISQPDPERGAGRAGGGGGRFGNLPLAGLMGGIGGAASNFFNKRRGGGGGQGPAAGGGGQAPPPYYDPVPQNDHRGQQPVGGTGKGLYPNVPVKDEGGGGSW